MTVNFVWIFALILVSNVQLSVQLFELKCLVCREVVKEITDAVLKEDPKKTVQVGSFRIQPDGSQKQSQIKYAGSELHLNEIMEKVCDSMENFAQAKHKETGELALLNLVKDIEKMDIYELIPDPDLNRSLKYYITKRNENPISRMSLGSSHVLVDKCENFIEDYEDDILSTYKGSPENENSEFAKKLCSDAAGYCSPIRSEL